MAKHLTQNDLRVIVTLIDGWDGKLTWEKLCEAAGPLVGSQPTRQTLSSHDEIKTAFAQHKHRLKTGFVSTRRPASLDIAEQRIRRLEAEKDSLQRQLDQLHEQFIRWQYNAYKGGVLKHHLEASLPAVDRDSSEGRP